MLLDGVVVQLDQLFHADSRVRRWNGFKADLRTAIRELLNDVAIFLLVFSRIPDLSACHAVEL